MFQKTDRAIVRMNILALVEQFPEVKKNRNNLCAFYWTHCEGIFQLTDIKNGTPAETITREFRMLVTMGKLVLDVEIKKALVEKEKEYFKEWLQK